MLIYVWVSLWYPAPIIRKLFDVLFVPETAYSRLSEKDAINANIVRINSKPHERECPKTQLKDNHRTVYSWFLSVPRTRSRVRDTFAPVRSHGQRSAFTSVHQHRQGPCSVRGHEKRFCPRWERVYRRRELVGRRREQACWRRDHEAYGFRRIYVVRPNWQLSVYLVSALSRFPLAPQRCAAGLLENFIWSNQLIDITAYVPMFAMQSQFDL